MADQSRFKVAGWGGPSSSESSSASTVREVSSPSGPNRISGMGLVVARYLELDEVEGVRLSSGSSPKGFNEGLALLIPRCRVGFFTLSSGSSAKSLGTLEGLILSSGSSWKRICPSLPIRSNDNGLLIIKNNVLEWNCTKWLAFSFGMCLKPRRSVCLNYLIVVQACVADGWQAWRFCCGIIWWHSL